MYYYISGDKFMNYLEINKILNKMINNTKKASTFLKVRGLIIDKNSKK